MKCALHIGIEMKETEELAPFINLDEEGRKNFKRKVFHCPVVGCARVAVGEGTFHKPKNWKAPAMHGHA